MGLFRKSKSATLEAPQGGKLYKIINTCAIVGLFVAVGIVVLMITQTIKFSSSIIGLVIAIGILCFSCILALPWIRKIENNEFKILSYVFLGLIAVSCVLWIVSDIVIIHEYKEIKSAVNGSNMTDEENVKFFNGIVGALNYLKASVFISVQFSVASFIATSITKYKKTLIPFQAIAYTSYAVCDFWFSGFLFALNIKKASSVSGLDISDVFSVNSNMVKFLVSKAMLTIFILAVAYVIVANAVIKRMEQRKVKYATDDLANGRVPAPQGGATVATEPEKETAQERLEKLKSMFDNKLITEEEYNQKKAEILKDM